MSRSALTLGIMLALTLVGLLATTALGATLQAAGGLAALKTGGFWGNLIMSLGTLAGVVTTAHMTSPPPQVVYKDKIVEKIVEVPVPAATEEPRSGDCCQSTISEDDAARNALDTVAWRLLKRGKLAGVGKVTGALEAVETLTEALKDGGSNESQPSPTVAAKAPPAAIAGVQLPPAGASG